MRLQIIYKVLTERTGNSKITNKESRYNARPCHGMVVYAHDKANITRG